MNKKIKELTLLLLYLTSWEEKEFGETYRRSWKGYPFETLNELTEDGYITGSKRSKSVYLTEEGIQEVCNLKKKYLGDK